MVYYLTDEKALDLVRLCTNKVDDHHHPCSDHDLACMIVLVMCMTLFSSPLFLCPAVVSDRRGN